MPVARVYRLDVTENERELLLDALSDLDLALFYGEGAAEARQDEVKDLEQMIEQAEPIEAASD